MPRGPSGSYTLPTGNPVVANTPIQSSWANSTLSDIAAELTNSLDRSGRGAMASPLKLPDGTATAPALTFNGDQNTGVYSPATDVLAITAGGAANFRVTATAVEIVVSSVTIGGVTFAPGDWAKLTGAAFTGNLSTTGALGVTGNATVGGTLGITGAATVGGALSIAAGSTSVAGISFTGDPNTGVYSPGADQLSVVVGGAVAVKYDAAGRTTNPARKQPCFRADTSAGNLVNGGTYANYSGEVDDTASFDAVSGIFTAPIAGWYTFSAAVMAQVSSGTGFIYVYITVSTGESVTSSVNLISTAATWAQLDSGPVYLSAGATVKLTYSEGNGTLSVNTARHFSGRLLG